MAELPRVMSASSPGSVAIGDDAGEGLFAAPPSSEAIEIEVEEEEAGTRLDVLLVRRVDGLSRAEVRRVIEQGEVRLNGRPARKGTRVAPGDRVALEHPPSPRDFDVTPAPEVPIVVVYEDADLVIVDKPAGLPTHPLRASERATLANGLVARYPEMQNVGYARREPGILHRLDNDTSGLLVAARSQVAFERLRDALRAGRIDKRYLALVHGALDAPRTIELAIAKHPTDPRRVRAVLDDAVRGRPATTEIVRAEPHGDDTLIEVRARVAVRHQIRVHLAAIGHPLVGDARYGGSTERLARHFLHASAIALEHPMHGARVRAEAPLPPELAAMLDR